MWNLDNPFSMKNNFVYLKCMCCHTIKISYDNYSMCSVTYKKLLCLYQRNHLNNTTFVIGNCMIISGSVPLFSTNFLHVHAIIASSVRCLFVGSAYRMTKIKRIIYIFLIYIKKEDVVSKSR